MQSKLPRNITVYIGKEAFTGTAAQQRLHCKKCTLTITLEQLYCTNNTATIELQHCNINVIRTGTRLLFWPPVLFVVLC